MVEGENDRVTAFAQRHIPVPWITLCGFRLFRSFALPATNVQPACFCRIPPIIAPHVTRLRVGNIEIDGSRVVVRSNDSQSGAGNLQPPPRSGLAFLDRIPATSRVLAFTGGATCLLALMLSSFAWWNHSTFSSASLFGIVLMPVGAAIITLAALKWWRVRQLPGFESLRADPATENRLAALERTMQTAGRPVSARTIAERLGWPPVDVDRGLGWLAARSAIEEDYDVNRNEYVYSLVRSEKDLATRLKQTLPGAGS